MRRCVAELGEVEYRRLSIMLLFRLVTHCQLGLDVGCLFRLVAHCQLGLDVGCLSSCFAFCEAYLGWEICDAGGLAACASVIFGATAIQSPAVAGLVLVMASSSLLLW